MRNAAILILISACTTLAVADQKPKKRRAVPNANPNHGLCYLGTRADERFCEAEASPNTFVCGIIRNDDCCTTTVNRDDTPVFLKKQDGQLDTTRSYFRYVCGPIGKERPGSTNDNHFYKVPTWNPDPQNAKHALEPFTPRHLIQYEDSINDPENLYDALGPRRPKFYSREGTEVLPAKKEAKLDLPPNLEPGRPPEPAPVIPRRVEVEKEKPAPQPPLAITYGPKTCREPSGEQARSCPCIDLRTSARAKLPHPRGIDQGRNGTCYAETMAHALSQVLNKAGVINSDQYVSGFALSCEAKYPEMFDPKANRSGLPRSGNPAKWTRLDGGDFIETLEAARRNGVCSSDLVHLDDGVNRDAMWRAVREMVAAAYQLRYPQTAMSKTYRQQGQDYACRQFQKLRPFLDGLGLDPDELITSLNQLTEQYPLEELIAKRDTMLMAPGKRWTDRDIRAVNDSINHIIDTHWIAELVARACKPELRANVPPLKATQYVVENQLQDGRIIEVGTFKTGVSEFHANLETVKGFAIKELREGRELALNYYSSVVFHPGSQDRSTRHASPAIAIGPNPVTGECSVLVQQSYGRDYTGQNPKIYNPPGTDTKKVNPDASEGGMMWVPWSEFEDSDGRGPRLNGFTTIELARP